MSRRFHSNRAYKRREVTIPMRRKIADQGIESPKLGAPIAIPELGTGRITPDQHLPIDYISRRRPPPNHTSLTIMTTMC